MYRFAPRWFARAATLRPMPRFFFHARYGDALTRIRRGPNGLNWTGRALRPLLRLAHSLPTIFEEIGRRGTSKSRLPMPPTSGWPRFRFEILHRPSASPVLQRRTDQTPNPDLAALLNMQPGCLTR